MKERNRKKERVGIRKQDEGKTHEKLERKCREPLRLVALFLASSAQQDPRTPSWKQQGDAHDRWWEGKKEG